MSIGKIMTKRIVVCGATGFIGRNMAVHFSRRGDCDVTGVYHRRPAFECPGLRWVRADLTRQEEVERVIRGMDVVIQAAATTSGAKDIVTRPYIHTTDNAVMNSYLFRLAHEQHVKHVIFFSCAIMYPSSPSALKEEDFDANEAIHPRYFGPGWTKLYVEKMCEFYASLGRTRYTAIRHSNIYGPHDKFDLDRSHMFGATITKVMTAKEGRIIVWGTGEESRDVLYVGDLVDFVERAIERQRVPFAIYNCGYGEAVRVNDLVRRIVEKSGRGLSIEHDLSQPSIPTSVCLDCSKAEADLGWRRCTALDEGIEKTLAWWRRNVREDAIQRTKV